MRGLLETSAFALVAAWLAACSSADGTDAAIVNDQAAADSGTGGSLGTGGAHAAGGASGQAGATGTAGKANGGSSGTGGSSATGGSSGTGGTSGAGGASGSGGATGSGGAGGSGGVVAAQGCPSSQAPGTWQNVTPTGMNVSDAFHGPITAGVDVVRPSDVYVHVMGDGTWKSVDCGMTWKKVSTGANADKQNTGRQWFATIDTNPHRDPATAPTLYVTQGYGANGVWKSTNGGVDWADVWTNNLFAEDGVTNISQDVGNDISGVFVVDSSGPDHLIAYLHSYWGTQGNNGVFESTDGGGKWIVHKAATFNFQPHSDILFPYDATTWMVTHGTSWPSAAIYRTTDSGKAWTTDSDTVSVNTARSYVILGSTIYAGTDYASGVYKSPDKGLTWTKLGLGANAVSWVAATATKLYASSGRDNPHVFHTSLSNDDVWVDDGAPGMIHGGANTPGVLFDGTHYVIVAPEEPGGVWRYVEP
jgi:hypothetical protein